MLKVVDVEALGIEPLDLPLLVQEPEFGGGEVWFDDQLIRKDGLFLPADLQPLNPEPLKAAG